MRILLHHPVHLPPRRYGGTERVVVALARGLVAEGCTVGVVAADGSRLPDPIRVIPRGRDPDARGFFRAALGDRGSAQWDVIHFMAPEPPSVLAWLEGEARLPTLTTIHGNGKPGERFPPSSVFLTRDHARRHGAEVFVHNGLDPDVFRLSERRSGAAVFLAKTSWSVKNLVGARTLARAAGVPLWIAGGRRPLGARLEAALRPGWRWCGPVDDEAKAALLARASALVFPVLWDEPFGLAVVEALMSGLPVLGPRRGSLPELVTEGEDGHLLEDVERLRVDPGARARWADALRRLACEEPGPRPGVRERAIERFHFRKMARAYLDLYRRRANGQSWGQSP